MPAVQGVRMWRRWEPLLGFPAVSSLAAFSACSWVSSPASEHDLEPLLDRHRTGCLRRLRIFTAAGINFALIFFDIFCLLDGIYEPASPGCNRVFRTRS